ncbi:unnamed protein product [Sphagnum balticum]
MASSVQEVQQLSLCARGSNSGSTLSSLQHNRGRRRSCSSSSNSSSIWGGVLTTTTRRLLVVCVPPWQRTSQLLQSIALIPRAQRLDTKRAPRDQGHCEREKLWREFFSDPSQWWDGRPEKKAEDIIKVMSCEQSIVVWKALVGACRIHAWSPAD